MAAATAWRSFASQNTPEARRRLPALERFAAEFSGKPELDPGGDGDHATRRNARALSPNCLRFAREKIAPFGRTGKRPASCPRELYADAATRYPRRQLPSDLGGGGGDLLHGLLTIEGLLSVLERRGLGLVA